MNDIIGLIMWVAITVFSFFSGAAWGFIRAAKINFIINVHGEAVTVVRGK